MRQNSSRDVICGMDMLVLCGRVLSCCSLCFTICMDGCTGTDVNRAFTSKEVMMDSHHHLSAKLSVIHTLIHRAQTVCSNPDLLCKEKVCLRKALTEYKYPRWALDKVERRLNMPSSEASDGANNQGITGAQPATSEVSMKVSRGSVEGIAYRPTSKVVTPSQTYWSPPRTKSPWSAIVGPYIGSNVVTSRDDEYIGEPPGPLVKDSKCT